MIGQNKLLNGFVAGARQLIKTNKHHAKKDTTILQIMTT